MEFLLLTKTGGILGPIAQVLGIIMDMLFRLTSTFGIMNIGLCIILFTLVVKVLMFPLTIKQQKSSKLMAVMQPEMQAIQKKYKDKKDQESMMKQNAEMQALYEKYGTSMTGGCLQLIIQMPILFALYQVIYNIPAYVTSVRMYLENIVNVLPANGVEMLTKFATDHGVSMARIGELSGPSKIIDFLYLLTPTQWSALQGTFPDIAEVISASAASIAQMNSFLGINLATSPWTGFTPNIAWLIPIVAGLSQWYSTKLMTTTQTVGEENPSANMMKSMNTMMPIMSAVFCFTFPAGIGIYWISSSVFQIIQQLIVNSYMNKIDIDEMIKKNLEKVNKKREKKGLPPTRINQNATVNSKNIQAKLEKEEEQQREKLERRNAQLQESNEYYKSEAKAGSLAEKARMVQKYNEKHSK